MQSQKSVNDKVKVEKNGELCESIFIKTAE